jgi:hypothetical protein
MAESAASDGVVAKLEPAFVARVSSGCRKWRQTSRGGDSSPARSLVVRRGAKGSCGEAGENQVTNAGLGMTQNIGGSGATVITHIFERVNQ